MAYSTDDLPNKQMDQRPIGWPVYILPSDALSHQRAGVISALSFLKAYFWIWFLCGGLGILIGLSAYKILPKTYRAQVLIVPASDDSGSNKLAGLASQFGGLASLAGVNIPSSSSSKVEALAIVTAPGFLASFVERHNLLPTLFPRQWNPNTNLWRMQNGHPPPNSQDGAKIFQDEVLTVKDDRKTGVIILAIDWRDRKQAAIWANQLVTEINANMRSRALLESQRSINFLTAEAEKYQNTEVRQAIYKLMDSEFKTSMLANVRSDYAFKILDAAQPPNELRFRSPKLVICLFIGVILGSFIGLIISLIRHSTTFPLAVQE